MDRCMKIFGNLMCWTLLALGLIAWALVIFYVGNIILAFFIVG